MLVRGALVAVALSACGAPQRSAVQPSTTTETSAKVAAPGAPAIARDGTLPTGASLMVRTIDMISSESSRAGSPFQAQLVAPIKDDTGAEIVPAGAKVFGRVVDAEGGGAVKKPRLEIGLTSIEVPGRSIPVATNTAGAEGGHGGAAKKVGAGALIGAAAGNAGAGAAVGGAAALMSGGKQIVIPEGTLVEFNLTQPARVK